MLFQIEKKKVRTEQQNLDCQNIGQYKILERSRTNRTGRHEWELKKLQLWNCIRYQMKPINIGDTVEITRMYTLKNILQQAKQIYNSPNSKRIVEDI